MPASQIPIPPIPYFTHEFCTFLTKKKRHGSFLEFGISIPLILSYSFSYQLSFTCE
jgi:hypothetical protein